jgi:hypothetical protein
LSPESNSSRSLPACQVDLLPANADIAESQPADIVGAQPEAL